MQSPSTQRVCFDVDCVLEIIGPFDSDDSDDSDEVDPDGIEEVIGPFDSDEPDEIEPNEGEEIFDLEDMLSDHWDDLLKHMENS